ncbi:dsp1-1-like protein [Cordyceps javanica]|uniref:Dsp1-1-like protein n=1 Tax=Cordyceps javanica TaxID=43265 RepID=A0A545VJ69_9HYPO|nr:dsp1-1-like protein [Cordyceps javanica]TQW01778.1 dsp1-1-like protein [Cordyceps javanica]
MSTHILTGKHLPASLHSTLPLHPTDHLGWRARQREQLAKNAKRLDASGPAITTSNTNTSPLVATWRPQDLPQLSDSIDSLLDEDATEFISESAPLEISRPRIGRLDSTAYQPTTRKKAPAKFALGDSCSSSKLDMSVELSKHNLVPSPKKTMFQIGVSSESASTNSSIPLAKVTGPQKLKQPVIPTSRNSQLEAESAIDSDTEDDYVDESAIDDDDDSSNWEDFIDDSGKSSVDDKFFQRVESKANLISRPSLITLMLAQNERQKNLSNQASHPTSAIIRSRPESSVPDLGASPNDSTEGPLMMKVMRPSNLRPIIEVPRSSAQPIVARTNYVDAQAALSPRTTRHNMLATELTESLRCHLLWERQQKTSTANAVLKRRHTSHDMVSLKQFPKMPCLKQREDTYADSWNQYFNKDTLDGYHSKGW